MISSHCEGLASFLENRASPALEPASNEILVSILVINQNGINHLRTLIPALLKNTKGINYELIVVDNASDDESINYLKGHQDKLHLTVIENTQNESFSYANNQAVIKAIGKYLVLLNNDIEPLQDWLHHLIHIAETNPNIGSVGSRLLYPYIKQSRLKNPFKKTIDKSCTIQHAGIAFKNEGVQFRPYNLGKGKAWNDPSILKSEEKVALTAACLLITKQNYLEVAGLDEQYFYGGEDVDLGLKLLKAGYTNYYCADSILFHHEFGTQNKEKKKKAAIRRQQNLERFQNKWFLAIKRKCWEESYYNKPSFYSEASLGSSVLEEKASKDKATKENFQLLSGTGLSIAIKIPAKSWEGAYSWGDYHLAVLLQKQLEFEGFEVLLQVLPEWDNDEGRACDIVIVLRGLSRYAIKPHQINLMWNISHSDDITLEEYEDYDKVFIASEYWATEIKKKTSMPVESMLQCTDTERFKVPSQEERNTHAQQLLYVGNSRQIYRRVLKGLLPCKYNLAIYGKGWKKIIPKHLAHHIKSEHISNDQLYKYYGSADILLNDHWDDMREKGFISNRIFDGLASGAFILTDRVKAMGKVKDFVCCYDSPESLNKLVEYYVQHPEERIAKLLDGIEYIKQNHTYKIRAKQFAKSIHEILSVRAKL